MRLDWGGRHTVPSGAFDDGYFGVGAVSCLAASKGAHFRSDYYDPSVDWSSIPDDERLLSQTSGCRVVAGTTNGDLRVWSMKDVLAAHLSKTNINDFGGTDTNDVLLGKNPLDILRGRPLGGHRGGVTCLDVPSHIYRPDSVVSGGCDGLIKLWSLRDANGKGRVGSRGSRMRFTGREEPSTPSNRRKTAGFEPQDVLTGHGGKILCIETAWHGDRLLSGGADKTLKLWDLASSGGKCFQTMLGQNG